jgi:cyclic pyranopterin phosphate synthase
MEWSSRAGLDTSLAFKAHGLPVNVSIDSTVRVKIIDACGLTCVFCHNEGTPVTQDNRSWPEAQLTTRGVSGRTSIYIGSNNAGFLAAPIHPDEGFAQALRSLHDMGYDDAHLTGGEPTLHPRLPDLVAMASSCGFSVGITSNGENGARQLSACAAAGLEKVNLSVFGTTAAELASVQAGRYQSAPLARSKIDALDATVQAAQGLPVKLRANLVLPDRGHVARARRVFDEWGEHVELRLLNSLDDGQESIDAVHQLLDDIGAEPVGYDIVLGASGYKVNYVTPKGGRRVSFKRLRPTRLRQECHGCPIDAAGQCQEGFYGVRLYQSTTGAYVLGLCIQRMDLCLPLADFPGSPQARQIRELVDHELAHLPGVLETLDKP